MASTPNDKRPWHGTTRERQEPLYDEAVATPTHPERARTLAAECARGTLSTMSCEMPGYPHGSMVTFAWGQQGQPVFLISRLAEHTKNLEQETRCSLMLAEHGGTDPLALGRLTALGKCSIIAEDDSTYETSKAAYLEAHPDARHYIDFADFNLWQLQIERVRYIGGFGRMSWFDGEEWASAHADPLREHSARIIEHMNEDHHDALVLYCRAFTKATDAEKAKMTGVDCYGFEMSVETSTGWRPLRLPFRRPLSTAKDVRMELVEMVGRAREKLA